ncbi:MAG: 4-alpha-glucanotransferase [Methanoregulaceae archaeon]
MASAFREGPAIHSPEPCCRYSQRASGLLLHITSLRSRFGTGDLGPAANRFVTSLSQAGQTFWQVLPLHPTDSGHRHSPYHATSLFALNPLLISPELLVKDGITGGDHPGSFPPAGVEGAGLFREAPLKVELLRAAARENRCGRDDSGFGRFRAENQEWLDDYALFSAIARNNGVDWSAWPRGIRDREPAVLERVQRELEEAVREEEYIQYLAFTQWDSLHEHASIHGIRIIGDLPLYPAYESADVWSHRDLFWLDSEGRPTSVAGVPPDYFSSTGQWWGNPIYRWEEIEKQGFSWWKDRVEHMLRLFDCLRVDHFRGLQAFWKIPAGAATAGEGSWVRAPGQALLSHLAARLPSLPLIAEDLGTITPDVRELMAMFGIPGMRVLQFGFDGDPGNPHAPGAIGEDSVLYTGTHDNNTMRGWFEEEVRPDQLERIAAALGKVPSSAEIAREMITLALESPAWLVVIPVQDLLCLGSKARMNVPGTTEGNWQWRLRPGEPRADDWAWLREKTIRSGR